MNAFQFQTIRRSSEESTGSETSSNSTGASNEDEGNDSQDRSSPGVPHAKSWIVARSKA